MRRSKATGVTAVHEARNALGQRLRELRQQTGKTGKQSAVPLSWPPSKVSKLENGRQTPTDEDIIGWTRETNSAAATAALLASLHTLEVQHAEWQRQLKGGLRPHQDQIAELDQETRFFRAHQRGCAGSRETPGHVVSAGQAFPLRPTEAALRYRLCSPDVMLGQLDRLVSLSQLPNVRLGIVGFEAQYVVAPAHGFWLLDDDRVMVETFSAEMNLAQPQEIEL